MEQSFIDGLDHRRYRLTMTQTVSFGIWFGLLLIILYADPTWGYYILLAAITAMFCLSILLDIPGKVVAGVLLWIGALGAKIAQLIVHRG